LTGQIFGFLFENISLAWCCFHCNVVGGPSVLLVVGSSLWVSCKVGCYFILYLQALIIYATVV